MHCFIGKINAVAEMAKFLETSMIVVFNKNKKTQNVSSHIYLYIYMYSSLL